MWFKNLCQEKPSKSGYQPIDGKDSRDQGYRIHPEETDLESGIHYVGEMDPDEEEEPSHPKCWFLAILQLLMIGVILLLTYLTLKHPVCSMNPEPPENNHCRFLGLRYYGYHK